MKQFTLTLFLLAIIFQLSAQNVQFTELSRHEYSGFSSAFTPKIDRLNRPYVYAASMQLGLVVFDFSQNDKLIPIDTLPPSFFEGALVSSVEQQGNRLYVPIGDFQSSNALTGLAILNVSDPTNIQKIGLWKSDSLTHGCADVVIDGNRAYLAAMKGGLVVLDLSDPVAPQQIGHFSPDASWPGLVNFDPEVRGIFKSGDLLYVCFDSGAFRILNIENPAAIFEVSRYINQEIVNVAFPAYNNVVANGTYAFLAIDYCGIEMLDISNPENPVQHAWYNPWECFGANWFNGDGHTNELQFVASKSLLFASAGDSELIALDVSDINNLIPAGSYGMAKDSAAVWGLDIFGDKIALTYIDNSFIPILQPFYSNWGGVRLLKWKQTTPVKEAFPYQKDRKLKTFPQPLYGNELTVEFPFSFEEECLIQLFDLYGRLIFSKKQQVSAEKTTLHFNQNLSGIFLLSIQVNNQIFNQKVIIQH